MRLSAVWCRPGSLDCMRRSSVRSEPEASGSTVGSRRRRWSFQRQQREPHQRRSQQRLGSAQQQVSPGRDRISMREERMQQRRRRGFRQHRRERRRHRPRHGSGASGAASEWRSAEESADGALASAASGTASAAFAAASAEGAGASVPAGSVTECGRNASASHVGGDFGSIGGNAGGTDRGIMVGSKRSSVGVEVGRRGRRRSCSVGSERSRISGVRNGGGECAARGAQDPAASGASAVTSGSSAV